MSKQGANALALDDPAVVATIQALKPTDFEKSMTSNADHRVWRDVYRPKAAAATHDHTEPGPKNTTEP